MRAFTLVLSLVVFALSSLSASNVMPVNGTLVDLENSTVTWHAKKVTGEHTGTVQLKEAELDVEYGNLNGGRFVMDMTSIANSDLEGDMNGKLVGHLKSDDFFGVETYPTAELIITNVKSKGVDGEFEVTADLTIKDITKEITFDASVTEDAAKAEIKIDRTQFDIKFRSGSFFENLGDKLIYDEFTLNVDLSLQTNQ